jgi:hypothetical protein
MFAGWTNIQPKLERLLRRCKKKHLEVTFMRIAERRYKLFVRMLSGEERVGMPGWEFAKEHPSIAGLKPRWIAAMKANVDMIKVNGKGGDEDKDGEGFWRTAFNTLLANSEPQKALVRSHMIALLKDAVPEEFSPPPPSCSYGIGSGSGEQVDGNYSEDEVLHRAVVLFSRCDCFPPAIVNDVRYSADVFPYGESLERIVWDNPGAGFKLDSGRHGCHKALRLDSGAVWCNREVVLTALGVLKALGLPADMEGKRVGELDGRLVCTCGRPEYRDPMSFTRLVSGQDLVSFGRRRIFDEFYGWV